MAWEAAWALAAVEVALMAGALAAATAYTRAPSKAEATELVFTVVWAAAVVWALTVAGEDAVVKEASAAAEVGKAEVFVVASEMAVEV